MAGGPTQQHDQAWEGGLKDRLSTAGEDALGELAQNLLENPIFSQAVAGALGAGERALQAQRSAMSALNIPSSGDLERIERRLRSLSDRLEELGARTSARPAHVLRVLLHDHWDEVRYETAPPEGSGKGRVLWRGELWRQQPKSAG